MALTLIPRHIRALSDHLNAFYRVLKGTDPDSLAVRLPGGGSFEVRHSATAAPVLRVTDAGATLTGAVSLPAQSITSAMIADGTIVGADIQNATIPSSKLITGAAITPESVTNAEIADGTVRTQELAANAVSQTYRAVISTGAMAQGGPFDVTGSGIFPTIGTGEVAVIGFDGTAAGSIANAIMTVTYFVGAVGVAGYTYNLSPTGGNTIPVSIGDVVPATTATGQHKLQYTINAGTLTLLGRMHVVILKR